MIGGPEDLVVSPTGWARFRGRRIPCALGFGGVTTTKREGDGATPIGVHGIEGVLIRNDRQPPLRSCLPVRAIGVARGWSDDPTDDLDYNREVRLPHAFRHEMLRRADPLYDLIAVLDFNRQPAIAGAGSAIFLHRWRRPRRATAGCVAFEPGLLRWMLETWRPWSRVIIQGPPNRL